MHKPLATILFILSFAPFVTSQLFAANKADHKPLKIDSPDLKTSGNYVRKAFLERLKKPFLVDNKSPARKLLIIGDSHAQDFLNGILENNYFTNYQISTRYIPTRCQIYLAKNSQRYLQEDDKKLCAKSDSLALAQTQIAKADVIILVASWRKWSALALPQTIQNLRLTKKQKLFVIGGKSFGRISVEAYRNLNKQQRLTLRNPINAGQNEINQIMLQQLEPTIFINLQQLVCGDSKSCPIFADEQNLISFDGGHLTKAGAKYIVNILFQKSSLGQLPFFR